MNKFVDKVFSVLSKPAKLIFIIGAFIYGAWFAAMTAMSIDGQFMNVFTNIITLFIGTSLICLPPLMLLLKKDELAKIMFVFLLGYWILTTPQEYFFLSDTFASAGEFFPVFVSIFLLVIGLGLVAILVMVILEMILGLKILRLITLFVAIIEIIACFTTAVLFMIEAGIMGADWTFFIRYAVVDMMILPLTVGCGCIALLGVDKKNA